MARSYLVVFVDTCLATSVLFYLSNNDSSCLSVWLQWINTTCLTTTSTLLELLYSSRFIVTIFASNHCWHILIYSSFIQKKKKNTQSSLVYIKRDIFLYKLFITLRYWINFWNSYRLGNYELYFKIYSI